ncbi:MAG: hypothetical protein Kow00121_25860 [Elainellaceae cyanobacterium]
MNQKRTNWISKIGLAASITATALQLAITPVMAQATPAIVREGYSLLERGWVNDAIASFREAVQRYPQSAEARLGLAIAYQRAGQDENAWNAYQQVLAQDPNNSTALSAVGLLGSYRPEWQRSGINALTNLLNQNSQNLEARAQRALLYGYQGQFAEAIADYEIVLAANPAAEVILGAAQIYTYGGDYPKGLALFEQYRATGAPIPNTAVSAYALALQETGSPQLAVQLLESRLPTLRELDDTAIQMRTALAIAYQNNNQLEAAVSTLTPLQGLPAARLPLARALSTIGRDAGEEALYAEATTLYRQVLEETPNPSIGLLTEIADVFSEYALTQPAALMLYQELVAQQPENQSLQVKRLALSNQLGQISRADLYEQLQTVLQPLPSDLGDQRQLAQALIRVDPPAPDLLATYQALLDAEVGVPFLSFRIAQIYMQQADLSAARQALAAYTATPAGAQDWAPELLLAEIERREGDLSASEQRYQTIIAANPQPDILTSARRGLAGIRLAQNDLDAALTLYEQLLAADPDDLASQLGQASIRYQTQQISQAEAEAVLDRWLTTEPVPEPPPELFNLAGALPPDPDRLPLYNALLTIEPANFTVNRRLVQVLAITDPDLAIAQVNRLIARQPDNINVYYVQGELGQALGDLELASQAYETILDSQPDNPDALSALGGVRFQQRRYRDAVALYEQVLSLRHDDLETRRVLAELSAAQDQPLTALEQLRQVQQLQTEAGISDAQIEQRIQQLQIDFLRRRGFQPAWERY